VCQLIYEYIYILVQFMELSGGREGACCMEQWQDGRGGQHDGNIDGVPKMGVMCRMERT